MKELKRSLSDYKGIEDKQWGVIEFKYLGNTGRQCISTFVQKNFLENVLEFLFSELQSQIFKILDGPKSIPLY